MRRSSGEGGLGGSRRRRSLASSPPSARCFASLSAPAAFPTSRFAPRRVRRLPHVQKPDDVDRELAALEGEEPIPLRNRALAELVYSAGSRSREAVDLDLGDVDFEQERCASAARAARSGSSRSARKPRTGSRRYLRDARPLLAQERRGRVVPLGARPPPRHEHASPRDPASRIASAMRSPRICSKAAPTSASSRSCSGTARSGRRRSTATWTAERLRRVYDRSHPRS